MAVSSGLKRSSKVSKCVETLGAEHVRESQAVSRCHEPLGAQRIHASHKVTRCHATLGAGPSRASRRVSTGPTTLGAECIHRSRKVYGTARLRHFSHSCVQETSVAIQLVPLTHTLVRETRKHAITRARNKPACNHAPCETPKAGTTIGTLVETPSKNAGPTRAGNPFPNISSRTEKGSPRRHVGNRNVHVS